MGRSISLKRKRIFFGGCVRLHICGGFSSRFFNLCAGHGIVLWDIRPAHPGYEACIGLKDFFRIRPLARKCRTRVRIVQRRGLPFFLYRNRKRKLFAAGFFCCLFLVLFLSRFVWRVDTVGNVSVARPTLLSWLAEQEAGYGAKKSGIDCKALAAKLREEFPVFTWVSVGLTGTSLTVSVKENDAPQKAKSEEDSQAAPTDLVADCDGRIVSVITRQGTPAVKVGDEVKAGDLLVSGTLIITDDSGETVSAQYCHADADIYIETVQNYEDAVPYAHETAEYTGRQRFGFYLKLCGKYLGVDMGTGHFEAFDRVVQERQLCLPPDFYLPVTAGIVTVREYCPIEELWTAEEAKKLAEERLDKFLLEIKEKGVQIFQNNVTISSGVSACTARGTLTVKAKTGRRIPGEKDLSGALGNSGETF